MEDPVLKRKIIEKTRNQIRFRARPITALIFFIGQAIACAAFSYITFESRVSCQRVDSSINCDWHTAYHLIGTKKATGITGIRLEPSWREEGPKTLTFLITEVGKVEVHGRPKAVEVVNNFIQDNSRKNLFFFSNRGSLVAALIFGGISLLTLKNNVFVSLLSIDKRINRLEIETKGPLIKRKRSIPLNEILDIQVVERTILGGRDRFFVVGAVLQDSEIVYLVPETTNSKEQEALCKCIKLFLEGSIDSTYRN